MSYRTLRQWHVCRRFTLTSAQSRSFQTTHPSQMPPPGLVAGAMPPVAATARPRAAIRDLDAPGAHRSTPIPVPDITGSLQPAMPEVVTELPAAFQPAAKRIQSAEQLQAFLESSPTARSFISFILSLNEAVKGKKISDACAVSPMVERFVGVLQTLGVWVDEIPPAAHTLRYGNPAYRDWFKRMAEKAPELVRSILPEEMQVHGRQPTCVGGSCCGSDGQAECSAIDDAFIVRHLQSARNRQERQSRVVPVGLYIHRRDSQPRCVGIPLQAAAVELVPYFVDSFGNAVRVDYGTGHETNFCALLYCLARLGAVGLDDRQARCAAAMRLLQ